MDATAKWRLGKAEKAYKKIQPFLAAQHTLTGVRVTVFRAVVGATVLRGSEIRGMNQKSCDPAQALVSKAVRVVVQCKESGKGVRVAAVWRELNTPPVTSEASARRARALMKYPSLKTRVGVLAR